MFDFVKPGSQSHLAVSYHTFTSRLISLLRASLIQKSGNVFLFVGLNPGLKEICEFSCMVALSVSGGRWKVDTAVIIFLPMGMNSLYTRRLLTLWWTVCGSRSPKPML